MGMKERIMELKESISKKINLINSEETTKSAIVVPFINCMGYDASDPNIIQCEFPVVTLGKKDRVDYAIFINSREPKILIECKSISEKINQKTIDQAERYFNALPSVTCIIITNGIEYWFFSDTTTPGIMDKTPFFIFNINIFGIDEYYIIKNISFEMIDIKLMIRDATIYNTTKLRAMILEKLNNPTPDIIKLLTDGVVFHNDILLTVFNNLFGSKAE